MCFQCAFALFGESVGRALRPRGKKEEQKHERNGERGDKMLVFFAAGRGGGQTTTMPLRFFFRFRNRSPRLLLPRFLFPTSPRAPLSRSDVWVRREIKMKEEAERTEKGKMRRESEEYNPRRPLSRRRRGAQETEKKLRPQPLPRSPFPKPKPKPKHQIKDIGSGNFGVAKLMRDKATGELVAVKFIERGEKVRGEEKREGEKRERERARGDFSLALDLDWKKKKKKLFLPLTRRGRERVDLFDSLESIESFTFSLASLALARSLGPL